ncbi:MAG: zinc ribbon domain-containing protein [Azonexus sp.]|nr:zinc ribbon domain-containing protein [Betaproteobacteria bacterium]MBP6036516.1 zinc ribbon domain-containing protein [Azonexus sp.]MBP6907125.1 zinc ribbon domain-containing protein [Azonexus sp.]
MFCSQCGTSIQQDSKFCFKCGKQINSTEEAANIKSETEAADNLEALPSDQFQNATNQRQVFTKANIAKITRRLLVVVLVLFLCVNALVVIVPSFDGIVFDAGKSGPSMAFVWAASFWYFWRLRGLKGWHGAISGVFVMFLVLWLGGGISAYVRYHRSSSDYVLENTKPWPAIKKHFPQEYGRLRVELSSQTKGNKLSEQEVASITMKHLLPLFPIAAKTTSDAAIMQFNRSKIFQLKELSAKSAELCLASATGDITSTSAIKIMQASSEQTKVKGRESFMQLFEDVGTYNGSIVGPEAEARLSSIYSKLEQTIQKKYSSSIYYINSPIEGVTVQTRCALAIALFEEAGNLPGTDGAFVLRSLFSQ